MEPSRRCTCLSCLLAIPLVVLLLGLFLGTLGLATIGILSARDFNPCIGTNSTQSCVIPGSIVRASTTNDTSTPRKRVDDEEDPNEYIYWMAGATGCGLLFIFIATFGMWSLEYAVYRCRKSSVDATDNVEMENLGTSSIQERSPSPKEVHIDIVEMKGNEKIVERKKVNLKKLVDKNCDGIGYLFILFFGLAFFTSGVLAILWSVAISYNFSSAVQKTVTPFVLVEFLAAVLCPIFFFISGILIAVVLKYITDNSLDGRQILPQLLKNVKFEKGKDSEHWIIANNFYFTLGKPKDNCKYSKIYVACLSRFPNIATWIITALAGLCIFLAASYFVDRTIDMQITVNSCDDPDINRDFSCFNATTFNYVDCIENTNVTVIHCFRFYQFGVEVDLISSVASTVAFYLAAIHSITIIFGVLHVLFSLKKNAKLWGGIFISIGLLGLTIVIGVFIYWAIGYREPHLPELPRINIVNWAQIIIVCCFIILIGFLTLISTWGEKKGEESRKKEGEEEKVEETKGEEKKGEERGSNESVNSAPVQVT